MVDQVQKRAVGTFRTPEDAEQAIQELNDANFPMDQVSVIAKELEPEKQPNGVKVSDRIGDQNVKSPSGIVKDTSTGAFWGSILVGLSSLAIPGAGPILAAGSLATALTAAVAGEGAGAIATNRLVGVLADLGIPKAQAEIYGDRLINGYYLVFVDGTEQTIQQAETVLSDRGIRDWGIYNPA